ncbi:MAG TPA: PEP-CTERM sorting domain-containing protein [Tepidisphaeraceae bacterium]
MVALILLSLQYSSSAAVITSDLTAPGSGVLINGADFQQSGGQPAGSGVINSFLRVQNTGVEQGYNTDEKTAPPGPHLPFDGKAGVSLNNGDVSVSSLAATQVTFLTTTYYAFALDIDESMGGTDALGNPNSQITLDRFQLYTSPDHHQITESFLGNGDLALTNATKRYDMDSASADHAILLDNATVRGGNGNFDMFVLVPTSFFAGANATDAFYLYCKFGLADQASSSFEEWGLAQGFNFTNVLVPEPASLSLAGFAMLALTTRRRSRVA